MDRTAEWVSFEQPLNERTRSLLRLEFLFAEYAHHAADSTVWGVRAGVQTLLDILSVIGRTDLRTELIRDLTEQRSSLNRLRTRPELDRAKLDAVLAEITGVLTTLHASGAHPSSVLRDNEFLFSVLNRSSIPGGTCMFDLPAFNRWLMRPYANIERDLSRWFSMLRPYQAAIGLYLRLLRDSTASSEHVASSGVYLHVPQGAYPLLRVHMPPESDVYPEISAGKHRFSFRFMRLGDVNQRNVQTADDVVFHLQCCTLNSADA
ncbi:cell division protein ZapD [Nevskia sp.]|uniref:cell division protein ZapD n=1 Tax=Nevskia sp. TaxID=1929292 RepID=UPI0025FE30FF|nr:cell division protein ZapD [Nevskia sp.]